MMRTYEYSISKEASAPDGMATVDSMCGYAVNAAYKAMSEEGYANCMLSKCSLEIDERPRTDETINIIVNLGLNNIVTVLNRNVIITDNEGYEIGRGHIDWLLPDSSRKGLIAENPSRLARRYISSFRSLLPETGDASGLQIMVSLDFKGPARERAEFDVDFKKICDSRYFFIARNGADTLCRAMLQTA